MIPQDTGMIIMAKIERCMHLDELMNEERKIISRHISKHKWYHHIEKIDEAVTDFINKYGWVMRESICDLCKDSRDCKAYSSYLKHNSEVEYKGAA